MKIGILWGIGPEASATFYYNFIKKLKKRGNIKSNADFPNIIINSINAVELIDQKNHNINQYIDWVELLIKCQVDVIVMVCNTIHLYRDLIIKKTWFTNILDLKDIIHQSLLDLEKICVLWTWHSISSWLYNFNGINYTNLPKPLTSCINKAIYKFNNGSDYNQEKNMLQKYIIENKNTYLLWCTEMIWILDKSFLNKNNIAYLDTMELLSNNLVQLYT